jgi:CHAT domain-containing protein
LDKEFKGVFEELQEKQDECNLFVEFAISPTKMLKKIVEKKPTIIHFSGHGMGEKTSGNEKGTRGSIVEIDVELARSGLVLQNDVTGKAQLVSTNAIANMFKTITKQFPINIVILNACYSENQAKAILQYVPYVIGMNDAVADSTAIELAKSFYNNYITNEKTVEEAFELAQAHLLLNDMPGADIPQLLCRDAK